MAKNFEQIVLLTDEPVDSFKTDELGLIPFSKVIAGASTGTEGPFTIGVYGDWGEGKTSLLKQAKSLIDEDYKDSIVTVWFNAWQYEREEHPVVPLVATIVRAIEIKEKELTPAALEVFSKSFRKIHAALRAVAYGFSANSKIAIPGFAEIEAGFVAKEMIDRYDKLTATEDPLLQRTLYYDAFETLEKVSKEAGSSGTNKPKIVVFIDDLDRCLPPKALKLLESIKLVLSQKGFVFVLAVSRRIVEGYLTHRYQKVFGVEYEGSGKSYLDKMIQLPIYLPSHEKQFANYIKGLLKRPVFNVESNKPVAEIINEIFEVLSLGSAHNPRNLVRFINNLIIDKHIWKIKNKAEFKSDILGFFAVSRILRQHLGDALYNFLVDSEDVCKALSNNKKYLDIINELDEPKAKGGFESHFKSTHRLLLVKLDQMSFIGHLLGTDIGSKWLTSPKERKQVNDFLIAEREESKPATTDLLVKQLIADQLCKSVENITQDDYSMILTLDLSSRKLKNVPECISELKNLQLLGLDNNQLTNIPESIRELEGLMGLYLSGNQLTNVPECISELKKLQMLNLSGNQLTNVPENIRELKNLKGLYLSGNQLTNIPECISELKKLQGLDLSRNQLTNVPEGIGELKNLKRLDLSDNKIQKTDIEKLKQMLPNCEIVL